MNTTQITYYRQPDLEPLLVNLMDYLNEFSGIYDVGNKAEADLVRRKFHVIGGEKSNGASSNRKNENRSAPGITLLLRKENLEKVNILIKHLNDAFAVDEANLNDGGTLSTKYITKSGIKVPKTLKDILWNLLTPGNSIYTRHMHFWTCAY
ncbi:hypothetical protein BDA99DRAFT_532890 [Phascolomyces articulosus]|uniref:Uncharacterized protein n=1 Tax=Phascolomyces articulosus TaxID=60185 RepID=A0AAD5PJA6_9FUNG|nr:hypothetical protein BDA99DRAFT_532890 [Phascolomyces articulosus]